MRMTLLTTIAALAMAAAAPAFADSMQRDGGPSGGADNPQAHYQFYNDQRANLFEGRTAAVADHQAATTDNDD